MASIWFVVVLLQNFRGSLSTSNYLIGLGSYDITGPAADVNMMGYANTEQIASGVHFRLRARAFIVAEPRGSRVVYVNLDACMGSQIVTIKVLERLKARYGGLYTEQNVAISGIHTHAGPGGYLQYVVYIVTSLGFVRQSFDVIVDGIEKSIIQAHENLRPGSIFVNKGELLDAGVNRSPSAYLNNPAEERNKYKYDVDKEMTLIKFVDDEWGPIGSFNWFATHGTSMSRTNSLVSGDNKGAAARFMEDWFEKKVHAENLDSQHANKSGTAKIPRRVSSIVANINENRKEWMEVAASFKSSQGEPAMRFSSVAKRVRNSLRLANRPRFVSAFCQTNCGDVSPNVLGAFCIDTGLPCDFNHSTCNGKNELCYGRGPGYPDEFESTRIIGERQFKKAIELFNKATERNPHRRARPTPSASTNRNPNVQNSNMKREISSFPIQDILAMEIPQKNTPEPEPEPEPAAPATSESLKVYLRIRPIVTLKPDTKDQKFFRQRQKNVWPQNPSSKNNRANVKKNTTTTSSSSSSNNEVCINVNDSHSVTLSPPASLQDSKRIKSEVYEGFSHVFASDSTQNEVFEKMVKPLVDDFLNGKNGLLAALGPSGSGKTHTVFGTLREPGMVHLALEQIFKGAQQCGSKLTREFKVSVFEIYSDRGKGERISDLSPDGGDLSMQQATIKGLQEVVISSAAQAESLIACAMLKRTTAMTNTNSQSSRSQCIINIHSFVRDPDVEPNNAVLTIVDLAGAEREKRTGNQGSRLIESNFINNTSMVFGLCLRSLLEHQSNPKKPLKMHFKNSLLTRYLRDYLEGKRRMTLILTVKPGENDYSDTSYLLRQASPFMKIKFTNVEEPSIFLNKRHIEMLPRVEQAKKMKCSGRYARVTEEEKSVRDEYPLLPKVTKRIASDFVSVALVKPDSDDLPRERNHQVMQNFAKALWNVLKQYKEKLMVAESEIQSLNEVIGNEKTRYLELEKELRDFTSCCSCSMKNSTVSTLVNMDTKCKAQTPNIKDPKCQNDSEPRNDQDVFVEAPECSTTQKFEGTLGHDQNIISKIEKSVHFLNLKTSECNGSPRKDREATPTKYDSNLRRDQIYKAFECGGSPRKDQDATLLKCDSIPRQYQDIFCQTREHAHSLNLRASECDSSPKKDQGVTKKSLDPSEAPEDVAFTQKCSLDVLDNELQRNSYGKPSDVIKPKRSPLPASSILLRDIPLGIEDENIFSQTEENVYSLNIKAFECGGSPRKDQDAILLKCDSIPRQYQDILCQTREHAHSLNLRVAECDSSPKKDQDVTKKSLDPSDSPKDVAFTQKCNLEVLHSELQSNRICKPLNVFKPKRRLLPASSILLRDIPLGIEDESEKTKGNRGGKKSAADETKRTQGSISLLRLLQSNLHV